MVKLRKDRAVLVYGDYQILHAKHSEIYVYTSSLGDERLLVGLNLSAKKINIESQEANAKGNFLINNYDTCNNEDNEITLKTYQATICKIN